MPDRHDGKKVGHKHNCVHGRDAASEKRKIVEDLQAVGAEADSQFVKSENPLDYSVNQNYLPAIPCRPRGVS
jgi:hypothetical protein